MMPKKDAVRECQLFLTEWTYTKEQIGRLEKEKKRIQDQVDDAEAEVARRQAELDSFVSTPSGVPSRVSPPKSGRIPRNAIDLFVGVGEAVIDALGDARRRGELRTNLQRAKADLRTAELQLENVSSALRDERLNDQRQFDRFYKNRCNEFFSQP